MLRSNGREERLSCGRAMRLIVTLSLLGWAMLTVVTSGVWIACEHWLAWRRDVATPIEGVDLPAAAPGHPRQ